jgi:hypothetical protein
MNYYHNLNDGNSGEERPRSLPRPTVHYCKIQQDNRPKLLFEFRWRVPRVDRLPNETLTVPRRKRLLFVSSQSAKEYAMLLANHIRRVYEKAGYDVTPKVSP